MKHSCRSLFPPTVEPQMWCLLIKSIPCHIFYSLAKPYLEALDAILDEEEGESEEEDDDEGEEGQDVGDGEEESNDDEELYRNLIEDVSDSDLE